jgi:hypothetical protein
VTMAAVKVKLATGTLTLQEHKAKRVDCYWYSKDEVVNFGKQDLFEVNDAICCASPIDINIRLWTFGSHNL